LQTIVVTLTELSRFPRLRQDGFAGFNLRSDGRRGVVLRRSMFYGSMSPQPYAVYDGEMSSSIPTSIQGQKYISLTTFRKTGVGVATAVWFGEDDGKLYVMTRSDMGKTKRIRNNPQVRVAPCTMRGTVTGAEIAATARILPPEEHAQARRAINRKYWAARIPFLWWRTDTYLQLSFG
jgi:PPOX class probable F420-dependent enzyme